MSNGTLSIFLTGQRVSVTVEGTNADALINNIEMVETMLDTQGIRFNGTIPEWEPDSIVIGTHPQGAFTRLDMLVVDPAIHYEFDMYNKDNIVVRIKGSDSGVMRAVVDAAGIYLNQIGITFYN